MTTDAGFWKYTILDAMPAATELSSLAVGDIDGDGVMEVVASAQDETFVVAWSKYVGGSWERHVLDPSPTPSGNGYSHDLVRASL